MAMMIEGSPVIRSIASWIGTRSQLLANSSRKSAIRTPTGSAIAVAIPTTIAEPTINGPMPPTSGLNGIGRSPVRKLQEIRLAPRSATDQTTQTSMATATAAARIAIASAMRLTSLRRRARAPARRSIVSACSTAAISAPPCGRRRSGARSAGRTGWSRGRSRAGSPRGRRAKRAAAWSNSPGTPRRSCWRACRRA